MKQFSYPLAGSALLLIALIAFWPTLVQMEEVWRHSETYMHCYFIVPMSLYMMWQQKHMLTTMQFQPTRLPLLLLVPVAFLWLCAYAIDVGFVSHVSQVISFQLLIWAILGHQFARSMRFPLMFLLFVAPFGESLTPLLQDITAYIGVTLLRLVDIPVYREGLYLHTPVTVFEVAVACSGLNFLISSTVISLLFAYLYFTKVSKQLAFVAFSVVLAVLANGIRAFLLMYIGEKSQMQYGFGADHYYYGWLVFGITVLISFRVGERFADPEPNSQRSSDVKHTVRVTPNAGKLVWVAIPLLLVAIARMNLPSVSVTEPSPALQLAGFSEANNSPLNTRFFDGVRRSELVNAAGMTVFAADYAVRQTQGDLITWHNWLVDNKSWTITDKITTDQQEYLQLSNVAGQRMSLVYWYQCGDVITSSKIWVKLWQLKAILLHEQTQLKVRMIALPTQDLLQARPTLDAQLEVLRHGER